jgi:hypothetical protein
VRLGLYGFCITLRKSIPNVHQWNHLHNNAGIACSNRAGKPSAKQYNTVIYSQRCHRSVHLKCWSIIVSFQLRQLACPNGTYVCQTIRPNNKNIMAKIINIRRSVLFLEFIKKYIHDSNENSTIGNSILFAAIKM